LISDIATTYGEMRVTAELRHGRDIIVGLTPKGAKVAQVMISSPRAPMNANSCSHYVNDLNWQLI